MVTIMAEGTFKYVKNMNPNKDCVADLKPDNVRVKNK